ncbi:hypothetical protein ROA7450_02434 [Roseovarius albus]|uniref:Uncharacterized protein n=1 Tax=Roseovarius albus TaxID=1247867 RepID=A0A1X6ZEC3_9RHOB|nr:hypothetical protein ROA7450_02434 [Roseovarius albus]
MLGHFAVMNATHRENPKIACSNCKSLLIVEKQYVLLAGLLLFVAMLLTGMLAADISRNLVPLCLGDAENISETLRFLFWLFCFTFVFAGILFPSAALIGKFSTALKSDDCRR